MEISVTQAWNGCILC